MTVLNCLLDFYKCYFLAITVELESIAPSPSCTARATNSVVELVTLSKTTALAACGSQPAHLPVLVDWLCDPLGIGVSSDSLMEWIDEDNLEEFVCGIFTNPVRIQDSQSPAVAPSSFLGHRLKAPGKLELVDTMVHGLAIGGPLGHGPFATTTTHPNAVDDIALLGLVAQPARLIRPGGPWSPVQGRELAVLPAAHSQEESHHVRLLLPPELLDVLVGAHLGSLMAATKRKGSAPKTISNPT